MLTHFGKQELKNLRNGALYLVFLAELLPLGQLFPQEAPWITLSLLPAAHLSGLRWLTEEPVKLDFLLNGKLRMQTLLQ